MGKRVEVTDPLVGVEKFRLTFTHEILMDNGKVLRGSLPETVEIVIAPGMPYKKQYVLRRLYERLNDFLVEEGRWNDGSA